MHAAPLTPIAMTTLPIGSPHSTTPLLSIRVLLLVLLLSITSPAHAWGAMGHRLVAQMAQEQLHPQTRDAVDHLLEQESGATLASIASWADEHRDEQTAAWHYVNFPRGDCTYRRARDCPDDQCAIEAIRRQLTVLSSAAPDADRLTALKYVVHLIADLHQPLHAGFGDDRGGNLYSVRALGEPTNLHTVWDSLIVRWMLQDPSALTIDPSAAPASASVDMSLVATESCLLVKMPGFYPTGDIGSDYLNKFSPLAKQRLRLAATRLAAVLNATMRTVPAGHKDR